MMLNNFCRHLSNGARVYLKNNSLSWSPCCYWDGPAIPFSQVLSHRKVINIDTPWVHQECQKCRQEEEYKLGYRRNGLNVIPAGIPDNKIAWLDIQFDMTCNGGCLICGPWSSSLWQSELARHHEYKLEKSVNNIEQNVKKVFGTLDTSELRMIQFLGGEPFLSDVDYYALSYIANPGQCDIKYTTNGSVYPKPDRIQRWKDFKSVLVNFSIDGIGKKFEYLRYPLIWNQVNNNIQRMINETDCRFHVNHTLTPFNILYYNEFEQWVKKTFPTDRFSGVHVHTAYGVMSVSACSDKLREKVKQTYGEQHNLTKLLADNPLSGRENFWNYINRWDQRRSQSWRSVFPDLVEVI